MSAPSNQAQVPATPEVNPAVKKDTTQENIVALRQKYERELAREREEKERLAKELDLRQKQVKVEEDDDDDEPYVDKRKLSKTLAKFGERSKQETQSEIQKAVNMALQEERKLNYLKQNPDFNDVLREHAEKIVQLDPELAETILEMPDGFERQKLVYKSIKALGLHKPQEKQPSIQEKIDANRRSPYYQPTNIGSAPYGNVGDFSSKGQENAYKQMQELKKRLRLG